MLDFLIDNIEDEEKLKRFTIGRIISPKRNKDCITLAYRIGRECIIDVAGLEIGKQLVVAYEDRSYFGGGIIKRIEHRDMFLWVTTQHRIYRFDYLEV